MHRVVVTGLGAIAPNGTGISQFWDGLLSPALPSQVATGGRECMAKVLEIRDNTWLDKLPVKAEAMDRSAQLAVFAAGEALAMAGIHKDNIDPIRFAAIIGNGAGGLMTLDDQYHRLFVEEKRRTHPYTVSKVMTSSCANWVSMAYGAKGPTFAIASACASGTHAVGLAAGMVKSGLIDLAICGGTEAPLGYGTILAWESMRVLAPDVCRPFSADRRGLLLGEGAGMMVIESEAHARARGAKIICDVMGFANCADAGDLVAPDPDGMARAMRGAIADAGLSVLDIGYINAHGTGTQSNDKTESEAMVSIFGEGKVPPVSSVKAVTGHGLGAAGGIEAVATILALQKGILPPTANHQQDDPNCPVDCIPNVARQQQVKAALSNSFAFGGLNASLLFGLV